MRLYGTCFKWETLEAYADRNQLWQDGDLRTHLHVQIRLTEHLERKFSEILHVEEGQGLGKDPTKPNGYKLVGPVSPVIGIYGEDLGRARDDPK